MGAVVVFSLSMLQFFTVLGKNEFLKILVFKAFTFIFREFFDWVLVCFLYIYGHHGGPPPTHGPTSNDYVVMMYNIV